MYLCPCKSLSISMSFVFVWCDALAWVAWCSQRIVTRKSTNDALLAEGKLRMTLIPKGYKNFEMRTSASVKTLKWEPLQAVHWIEWIGFLIKNKIDFCFLAIHKKLSAK